MQWRQGFVKKMADFVNLPRSLGSVLVIHQSPCCHQHSMHLGSDSVNLSLLSSIIKVLVGGLAEWRIHIQSCIQTWTGDDQLKQSTLNSSSEAEYPSSSTLHLVICLKCMCLRSHLTTRGNIPTVHKRK